MIQPQEEAAMSNEALRDEAIKDNPVEEPTSQTVHDPVCHMDIVATSAAGNSEYEGLTFYFCSTHCQEEFVADPVDVLRAEGDHDHGRPVDHPS
jgi:YHS domain-containing protein